MKNLKVLWDNIPTSWKVTLFICLGVTLGLLITGFLLPPMGTIDPSVFKACGIIAIYPTLFTVFICALMGMDISYDIKEGKVKINHEGAEVPEVKIPEAGE